MIVEKKNQKFVAYRDDLCVTALESALGFGGIRF